MIGGRIIILFSLYMLEFQTIVFYCFATITLAAALGVVFARNPVYAALFLVAAFVASAGLWLLLLAEFLAIVLVLVYVGAVMVLFLFVLMMLDINVDRLREGFFRYSALAAAACALLVWEISSVLSDPAFADAARFGNTPDADNTRALGKVIYTDYVYPFELAAVLLLVAIIAAVALTLRRRKNTKYTDPAKQVRAQPARRVRLVSLTADNPPGDKQS